MKDKKAQVTIFIIMGIVMLVAVLLLFYFIGAFADQGAEDNIKLGQNRESDIVFLNDYFESCVDMAARPLVLEIASKGGKLNPTSDIYDYDNDLALNTLSTYSTYTGYVNSLLAAEDMADELSIRINQDIQECIKTDFLVEKGFEVEVGVSEINTLITDDSVIVELNYPLTLTKPDYTIELDEFAVDLDYSLGSLHKVAIDIINDVSSQGYFDKDSFMLRSGGMIEITKRKPYPDKIYEIREVRHNNDEDLIFRFAIKGQDIAGTDILRLKEMGCCFDAETNMCYENIRQSECKQEYFYFEDGCDCTDNMPNLVEGCCSVDDNCYLTTSYECSSLGGTFHEDDYRCAQAECSNLDCQQTYDYQTDSFINITRKHSESWCGYESYPGKGYDYVGSRHYLHSCINGIEYIEPCSDYREELCTEEIVINSGEEFSKATCRINRWFDCSAQATKEDCEDETKRDCAWYDDLLTEKKCHPEVPPGLKFWDESVAGSICSAGSFQRTDDAYKYPTSWGHSALLYCLRLGDCGNHRNIADVITEGGFFYNIKPLEDWVYWEDGYNDKGNEFTINLDPDERTIPENTTIAYSNSGGDAVCDPWTAPYENQCELCNSSSVYECTEYKCRSLGYNCVFREADKSCIESGTGDTTPPKIGTVLFSGYSYHVEDSFYFPDKRILEVSSEVMVYEPFRITFRTDEPTRCKLSLNTGLVSSSLIESALGISLPQIPVNYNYSTSYDFIFRFPANNISQRNEYLLSITCEDEARNVNDENLIKVETKMQLVDTYDPEILEIMTLEKINKTKPVTFDLFVNEPFSDCRYTFDLVKKYPEMTSMECSAEEYDVLYNIDYPLGSYRCRDTIEIPEEYKYIYFSCMDKAGNTNSNERFIIE